MSLNKPIPVALIGVTGYTGMELTRLLTRHPEFELSLVTSRQEAGQRLDSIYPQLMGEKPGSLIVEAPSAEKIARNCTLAFLAVPHGTAMDMAADLLSRKVKVVDFSADFRLQEARVYKQWYGLEHRHQELLSKAVYGLIELFEQQVRSASLVANPGCYPSSVILALYPALAAELINPQQIIVDSKSGASGAGRKASTGNLFCEVYDNFRAYNLGKHRHTPEIEQELSRICGQELNVSFNPHLLPIDRGILSTIYTVCRDDLEEDRLRAIYEDYYSRHPWVRVLPQGVLPQTRWVRGSMYCDIGLVRDTRSDRLIIISAIDNLCRGASGQALANANLMCGLNLNAGLELTPLMP
jgi:N-acetyl-gamma-glutamyl-phosphate reductase